MSRILMTTSNNISLKNLLFSRGERITKIFFTICFKYLTDYYVPSKCQSIGKSLMQPAPNAMVQSGKPLLPSYTVRKCPCKLPACNDILTAAQSTGSSFNQVG